MRGHLPHLRREVQGADAEGELQQGRAGRPAGARAQRGGQPPQAVPAGASPACPHHCPHAQV